MSLAKWQGTILYLTTGAEREGRAIPTHRPTAPAPQKVDAIRLPNGAEDIPNSINQSRECAVRRCAISCSFRVPKWNYLGRLARVWFLRPRCPSNNQATGARSSFVQPSLGQKALSGLTAMGSAVSDGRWICGASCGRFWKEPSPQRTSCHSLGRKSFDGFCRGRLFHRLLRGSLLDAGLLSRTRFGGRRNFRLRIAGSSLFHVATVVACNVGQQAVRYRRVRLLPGDVRVGGVLVAVLNQQPRWLASVATPTGSAYQSPGALQLLAMEREL